MIGPGAIFPRIDWNALREAVFQLGYSLNGGSGLNWQPSEVMRLSLGDIMFYVNRLNEQRQSEAAAIRKARSES